MERIGGAPALVSFHQLASLLLPADPNRRAAVVEAGMTWSFGGRQVDADVVVWGRAPLASGLPIATVGKAALTREWALRRLAHQPPRPWRSASVHRWVPPQFGTIDRRERIRAAMMAGAIVELSRDHHVVRVVDAAAAAAGIEPRIDRFSAGSSGSLISTVRLPRGSDAIFRVGRQHQASDPARGAEALDWVTRAGLAEVPRPIASGEIAGASWTLESRRPGTRPGSLSEPLLHEVARFLAQLPATSAPPMAFFDDLEKIAAVYPENAAALQTIAAFVRPSLRALPAITRHGDLWAGNLLIDHAHLSGVVDWDAWHPRGVPGTDLLHLIGMRQAIAEGRELGAIWLDAPWRSQPFHQLASAYWPALDIWPDVATVQAIAIAWWAAYVAHSLDCDPSLVSNDRWTRLNVDDVLAAMDRIVI